MNAAGVKGSTIASKYKGKGLRVIAVDIDGTSKDASEEKWRAAGADFYLYDDDYNCFREFWQTKPGFPYNIAIKEWKGTQIADNESAIKAAFGF